MSQGTPGNSEGSRCSQGHPVPPGAAFCPQCGGAVLSASTLPPPVSLPALGPLAPATLPPYSAPQYAPQYPPQYAPPPAKKSKLPWIIVGAVVVLALVGLVALQPWKSSSSKGSGSAAVANTTTVTGEFVLYDSDMYSCSPSTGYNDIGSSTPVTLKNESGTLIGSTSLGMGTGSGSTCTWRYSFPGVSTDFTYYTVSVGRRGEITTSHSEMVSNGWKFSTSLGL